MEFSSSTQHQEFFRDVLHEGNLYRLDARIKGFFYSCIDQSSWILSEPGIALCRTTIWEDPVIGLAGGPCYAL